MLHSERFPSKLVVEASLYFSLSRLANVAAHNRHARDSLPTVLMTLSRCLQSGVLFSKTRFSTFPWRSPPEPDRVEFPRKLFIGQLA